MKNIEATNNPPQAPLPAGPGPDRARGRQALRKGGMVTPPFGHLFPARGRQGRLGGISRRYLLALVGATLRGRPSAVRFLNPGVHGGTPLRNSRGVSILFLVMAMLLMITIGYVFSYLIPTKQKSVSLSIHSTQAFFIAQSGVEFAVRYAVSQSWTTPAALNGLDNLQRNLGRGRFTLDYDRNTNTLISIGVVQNAAERRVKVSNFTSFLQNPKGVILDPRSSSPCWTMNLRRAQFYIRNAREDNVTFTRFSASWTQTGTTRTISDIYMAGTRRFNGSYSNGAPPVNLGSSQTINSNVAIQVLVYWSGAMTTCTNIVITFYPATGNGYTFYLDPAGGGLSGC